MTGGQLGVDRVGLAASPARVCVRLVDLEHPDTLGEQMAGQAGSVGAGRLHPDPLDQAERGKPGQQLAVTRGGDRKRLASQQAPTLVKRRGLVGIGVRVDAADDTTDLLLHAVHCCPSLIGGTAGRVGGHNSDEALVANRFL